MSLMPDRWIREMAREQRMIEPFVETQHRRGVISFGLSSYGYDARVAPEFRVFTNVDSAIIDPKDFTTQTFVERSGPVCTIPPNSFALARTVEYFRIPDDVLVVCLGKCVTGDAHVVDADTGAWLPIAEFIEAGGGATLAAAGDGIAQAGVSDRLNNGVLPVWRVRTRLGLEIDATPNHPFKTFGGWTTLAELRVGSRIATARRAPVFGRAPMSVHEATFLGFMIADGQCCTPGSSPRFTNGDPATVDSFRRSAEALGFHVRPVGRFGHNVTNRPGRGGVMSVNRARRLLDHHGVAVTSARRRVPRAIFTAPREAAAAFLRAAFTGDGHAYVSRNDASVGLEYTSISKELMLGVRHLLLRFGVFSTICTRQRNGADYAYTLRSTDRRNLRTFAEQIGFVAGSTKQNKLESILATVPDTEWRKSNFDTLPSAAWRVFGAAARARGRSLNSLGAHPSPQSMPLALARELANMLDDEALVGIANADFVWDTVVSIQPIGPQVVYDLTVPDHASFLANELIVHNSTYARCGIIVNVTPLEPAWEGHVTLEISNTTPLPARIYADEGICQFLFFQGAGPCEVTYADRGGKYMGQRGVTPPRL